MASQMKLYELGAELEAVIAQIVENDGLLDENTEQLLNDLDLAFDEKVERVVMAIRTHQARAKMVQFEIDRLGELKGPHTRAVDSLKGYLFTQMQRVDKRKVDRPLGKAWIQKNARPSIRYAGNDPDALSDLPSHYIRVKHEVDGERAYEDWKEKKQLPGCLYVDEGSHLRFK